MSVQYQLSAWHSHVRDQGYYLSQPRARASRASHQQRLPARWLWLVATPVLWPANDPHYRSSTTTPGWRAATRDDREAIGQSARWVTGAGEMAEDASGVLLDLPCPLSQQAEVAKIQGEQWGERVWVPP